MGCVGEYFDRIPPNQRIDGHWAQWTSDITMLAVKKKLQRPCEVRRNDILYSNTGHYLVTDFSGEGCYGKVVKGVNLVTDQNIALKILKREEAASEQEINMLEFVSILNPAKKNLVQFIEKFKHEGHTCLAFEMLDKSLYQLLEERDYRPLTLREIRPITHQLLTAFDALKSIGVIYSDLKLDNIMLVNHREQPFRVKLIDFGLALTISQVKCGMEIQPLGLRAPEVTLGLPISEQIDMWSLGCVLFSLYTASFPFATNCEYQMMRNIVEVLGKPPDHLLISGKNSHKFFKYSRFFNYTEWRLKTPCEYKIEAGIDPKLWTKSFNSLEDLMMLPQETWEFIELQDRREFVDLLQRLLDTDSTRRITPGEALRHPYVSMAHLVGELNNSVYVHDAFDKMLVCPIDTDNLLLSENGPVEGPEFEGYPTLRLEKLQSPEAPQDLSGVPTPPQVTQVAPVVHFWNVNVPEDGKPTDETANQDPDQDTGVVGPSNELLVNARLSDEEGAQKMKKGLFKMVRDFFGRVIEHVWKERSDQRMLSEDSNVRGGENKGLLRGPFSWEPSATTG